MGRISQRALDITESPTLAITAKAKELRASGANVVGFGAGEPDFPTPDHIVEAAVRAARDPRMHKYSPAPGLPELREAIAAKTKRDSGYDVTAEQVLVTNGGKHAIYNAFQTILEPGDEVLLPAPYWVTYPESIKLAGGIPVEIPTGTSTGFRVSTDQLDRARTDRTKALVFVSPSNPTGAVYTPEEVETIGRWAADNGVWVLTDEIYEHLTYDGHTFSSIPVSVPELAERCIVVNGVAKTYAMTGWRVGWMIAPSDVTGAAKKIQSHSTSNVANVAQAAALEAVSGSLDAVAEMRTAFDRRRRKMHELLSDAPGVECLLPEGAFYCFPSFEGALGKTYRGRKANTTLELAEVLLEEAEVAMVPGEAFGAPGYARLSFALDDESLVEGVTRIAKFLAEG